MIFANDSTNDAWQASVADIMISGDKCAPRGLEITESIAYQVHYDLMDPCVTLAKRKMNFRFMFGEAWWILSGSNDVTGPRGVTQFMKSYERYSDDGIFLRGAYGPKFVDQVGWAAQQMQGDLSTRQAVVSFWRERPGPSKDIPCTLTQQYFVRDGHLSGITTMRSNDMMKGFCYDSFTFAHMIKHLGTILGGDLNPGCATIQAGSAHVYATDYDQALDCTLSNEIDAKWSAFLGTDLGKHGAWGPKFDNRHQHLEWLRDCAESFAKT